MAGVPLFPRWKYTRRGRWIWTIAAIIFIINLISFFAGCFILGGDALTGEQKESKYLVNNHGKYTEVTEAQWLYSYVHVIIFFASVPAIVGVHIWLRAKGHIRIRTE